MKIRHNHEFKYLLFLYEFKEIELINKFINVCGEKKIKRAKKQVNFFKNHPPPLYHQLTSHSG